MSVTAATELWRLSANELAELISTRQASSREVIEAHLRRIEAVNPKLNAVTLVLGEQALEAAEAADRAAAAGGALPRGPVPGRRSGDRAAARDQSPPSTPGPKRRPGGAAMTTTTRPRTTVPSQPSSEEVWREIASGSFLVLSYVTPSGGPRSAGVMYKAIGRKLYIVTGADSWKARHIAADGRVAVTVPVRRGGILSLLLPIPPATISFHGTAVVHSPDAPAVGPIVEQLGSVLPEERRGSVAVIEVIPDGTFTTYGVGVSLTKMRDTDAARAHVPVTSEGSRQ